MALPAYDVDKYHVGLGGYGFILDGNYRKHEQHEGMPQEFGGERDLVAEPGLARWTQDSFVGGQYQYTWQDPAMIRSCSGMMPSIYEDTLRSVPYMGRVWAANYSNEQPVAWYVVDGKFVVCYPTAGIKVLDPDDGTEFAVQAWQTSATSPDNTGWGGAYAMSFYKVLGYDPGDKLLFVMYKWSTTSPTGSDEEHVILRYIFDWTVAEPNRVKIASVTTGADTWEIPDELIFTPTASDTSARREPIHASFGQGGTLFTFKNFTYGLLKPFDIATGIDGTSTYWVAEAFTRLPAAVVAMTSFNGLHYLLVSDEESWVTNLYTWDGATLHLVIEFPYSFQARCIQSYGGRLFVGGAAKSADGSSDVFGELYEISGETLRLVRTFSPEYRNSDVTSTAPSSIEQLAVFEGLLWFFNSVTKHFEAYDLARDAFYGGPLLSDPEVEPAASDWELLTIRAFRDNLYVFVFKPSDEANSGMYRISDNAMEAAAISGNLPAPEWELVTSDFLPEPARDKGFSTLKLLTRYGAPDSAEYSVDGGISFTALSQSATETSGTLTTTTFDASVIKSRQVCFRFRGTRDDAGDAEFDGYTEIIAFTCSFQFLDTGFKVWQFTVLATDLTELLDGTELTQDISEIASQLWAWKEDGTKIAFVDLDGSSNDVRILDIAESMPYIGPNIPAEVRPEAYFTLVLAEV